MGGHPGQVHPPGVELDEKENVQPTQQDGLDCEEVAGEHGCGLGQHELLPARALPNRRRIEVVPLEDRSDARRGDPDTEPYKLTVDPAVSPGWVLLRQANDERHSASRDSRSSWRSGVSPSPAHHVPVPSEQGLGLYDEPTETSRRQQTAESGEECPISWAKSWASNLASKYGHFVAEDDDLDRPVGSVMTSEAEQLSSRTNAT